MKEIDKLAEMLNKEEIEYDFRILDEYRMYGLGDRKQIRIYYKENDDFFSVIQGYGTYGNEQNLLEIMGLLTPEEAEVDSVCGFLTAENVFKRVIKAKKEGII